LSLHWNDQNVIETLDFVLLYRQHRIQSKQLFYVHWYQIAIFLILEHNKDSS